jgi:hypothetical protein
MGKVLPCRPFTGGESDVQTSVHNFISKEPRRGGQRALACPWILWQLIHLIREFMVASK